MDRNLWRLSAALFALLVLMGASTSASAASALGPDVEGSQISSYVGNPINVVTGNKYQAESDLSISSLLEFERHYNSQQVTVTALGPYWTHSYSSNVSTGTLADGTQFADVARPTGRQLRYRLLSGAWTGDPNVAQTLAALRDAGGSQVGWEWRDLTSGRAERYDLSGRLVRIVLRDNRSADVMYAPSGQLSRVQQDDGRALAFSYDTSGRLSGVSTPDGKLVVYGYDAWNRLATVDYPGGGNRTYLYNEQAYTAGTDQSNVLTGILHDGVRYATYGYDATGLAVSTEHAGGVDRYIVTRNADGTAGIQTPAGSNEQRSYVTHFDTPTAQSITPSCTDGCTPASTSYQYDANGYVSKTIRAGVTTDFINDSRGRVTQRTDAVGTTDQRTIQTDWDAVFGVAKERRTYDAANTLVSKTVWGLNGRGQVTSTTVTDPIRNITRTTASTYCEQANVDAGECPRVGLLTKVDGPRTDVSDVTQYLYRMADAPGCDTNPSNCLYRKGDLWKVLNAKSQAVETLSYDGSGRPLSVKDANGVVTDLQYNERGWLRFTKVRGANDAVETDDLITEMQYWPAGQVKKVIQPDGSYTYFEYDDAHRLKAISNNVGDRIDYRLDNAGNRLQEDTADAQGTLRRTLSRVYNQLGQLKSVTDADQNATATTYDGAGNPDLATNPKNRVADTDHDRLNRLSRTLQDVAGIAAQTDFKYDVLDNLTKVIDPKRLTTAYLYDGLGDLRQLDSPDTGTTVYTYDGAGNLQTKQDARGASFKATYSYDALNRLTGIAYATTSPNLNVGYAYDTMNAACPAGETFAIGRLTRITDGSGSTQYCYDRFGHMVRKIQTTASYVFTTGYEYGTNGQLAAMRYPSGMRVDYGYDAAGRPNVVRVTRPGSAQEVLLGGVEYLPFGPASELRYGNNERTLLRQYDRNYRPMVIQDSSGLGLHYAYGWDALGNLDTLSDSATAPMSTSLATYGYDGLNRLTGRYAPSDVQRTNPLQGYAYDATGNRLSDTKVTDAAATTAYNYLPDSHRLMQVGSAARSYDAMGNTLTARVNNVGKVYTYDVTGRLRTASDGTTLRATYSYNGKGEQVRRYYSLLDQTQYVYDEAGHWIGQYGYKGLTSVEFIWLGDLPVGMYYPASSTTTTLFQVQPDHLGTPRSVIDPVAQKQVWSWPLTGEAFGNTQPLTDPDGDGRQFVLDMRFPGQRLDGATGLNYNYFRDYEAGTGRYAESDPIGLYGGISTYQYVRSAPLAAVDPDGLQVVPWPVAPPVPMVTPIRGDELPEAPVVPWNYSPTNGSCPSPNCDELKQRVRRAKEIVGQLGKCKPNMRKYELLIRHAAWLELAVARAQRDGKCGGMDEGHQFAQAAAWVNVSTCALLLFSFTRW